MNDFLAAIVTAVQTPPASPMIQPSLAPHFALMPDIAGDSMAVGGDIGDPLCEAVGMAEAAQDIIPPLLPLGVYDDDAAHLPWPEAEAPAFAAEPGDPASPEALSRSTISQPVFADATTDESARSNDFSRSAQTTAPADATGAAMPDEVKPRALPNSQTDAPPRLAAGASLEATRATRSRIRPAGSRRAGVTPVRTQAGEAIRHATPGHTAEAASPTSKPDAKPTPRALAAPVMASVPLRADGEKAAVRPPVSAPPGSESAASAPSARATRPETQRPTAPSRSAPSPLISGRETITAPLPPFVSVTRPRSEIPRATLAETVAAAAEDVAQAGSLRHSPVLRAAVHAVGGATDDEARQGSSLHAGARPANQMLRAANGSRTRVEAGPVNDSGPARLDPRRPRPMPRAVRVPDQPAPVTAAGADSTPAHPVVRVRRAERVAETGTARAESLIRPMPDAPAASRAANIAGLHAEAPSPAEPLPTIRVTIGRIEVRSSAPVQPPATSQASRPRPGLSLDDYLKRPAKARP